MQYLFLLTMLLPFSPVAHAEYRAYELAIRNVDTGAERMVLSTFDHIQYPGYYPLNAREIASYVKSWRCRGRTGNFTPICPEPETSASVSKPKPNLPPPSP